MMPIETNKFNQSYNVRTRKFTQRVRFDVNIDEGKGRLCVMIVSPTMFDFLLLHFINALLGI